MKLLVVGAGEMGRWIGRALQDTGQQSVQVTFLDAEEAVATDAATELDASTAPPETNETFDIVCIAVPIPAATTAIEAYAPLAEEAMIDITGTMAEPIEAMQKHAPDCERASLHPLFAASNEPGNIPTVVDQNGQTIAVVLNALRARGNDVFETTAKRHDELMETVQARTHAAVLSFALSAQEDVPDRYHTPISAALADLAEQVTSGESSVYADIQYAFDGAEDIADAAREIADADRDGFEALYDSLQDLSEPDESEPAGKDD